MFGCTESQCKIQRSSTCSSGKMTVLKAKAIDPMAPIASKVPVADVSWMPKSLGGEFLPVHKVEHIGCCIVDTLPRSMLPG